MSFLGSADGWPSPQLREARLPPKAWGRCYARVCHLLRTMYQLAGLVHGDLSEYNLLYHEGRPFVIDVGQAVRTAHPRATQYLRRDIAHVNAFFARQQLGGRGAAVVGDAALLAFVRMRRPRGGDAHEEEEVEEEEGEVEAAVVEGILARLMEGSSFEAAVGDSGFADRGGRAGQEEQEEEEGGWAGVRCVDS